ncbi:hypothetical protein [Aneurinibacillus terranovensis]|uniref:hypothetical protein n=1 Tax=Aneurinibacillus terranovensis TaxID=278991 RepID=UPI00041BAE46|nr:hypothetical protein [Aneurinibacillus terranovensis]
MEQVVILQKLRSEIGDAVKPYLNSDDELLSRLEEAVGDYSKYRPRRIKANLTLVPGSTVFPLPADCQTWVSGLEDYEVLSNALYLEQPVLSPVTVPFVYLGDHVLQTIPDRDISILFDFIMWKHYEAVVSEGAEISGLKLGKGLDIKFDNFDELNKAAERRKNSYINRVTRPLGGGT